MATTITGANPIRGIAGLQTLDEAGATKVLEELATNIRGKGGVLKLMHTSKNRDMSFERKSGIQFFARRDSKMATTAQALRTLYEKAGLSEQSRVELDRYLQAKGNRVGGTAFSDLIKAHLKPAATTNPSGYSDEAIARLLPRPAEAVGGYMRAQVFGSQTERTQAGYSNAVKFLFAQLVARPEVDAAYPIGEPGSPDRLQCLSVSAKSGQKELDCSRPVVLFLGGSHSRSEAHATEFASDLGPNFGGAGLNLLAINYRGFGESAPVDVTPRTVRDDGVKAYKHLRELGFRPDQIIVRGYSMGAAVAAHLHAEAQWRGERLGGVIYDRPMVSAAGVARIESWLGPIAANVTTRSVGDFGAASSLARLPAQPPDAPPGTPVRVLVDTSREHGRAGQLLASDRGYDVIQTGADHLEHDRANLALAGFLGELVSPRHERLQALEQGPPF